MSVLLNLTGDDFTLGKGQKGHLLFNNIRQYSVVLFYATTCEFCKDYLDIFKIITSHISGCTFAIANVQKHMKIVHMSKQTMSPVEFVPLIIFYVDGRPFMRFNGEADLHQIKSFIIDVTKQLSESNKSKFYEDKVKQHEAENKIPDYTIGKPKESSMKFVGDMICYGDVCYLSEGMDITKSNEGKKRAQQQRRP